MSGGQRFEKFSFASGANTEFLESLYKQYQQDSDSVDATWRKFFEGYDFAAHGVLGESGGSGEAKLNARVEALINAYRRLGHLSAHLNPLEAKPPIRDNVMPAEHGLGDADLAALIHPANLPKPEMTFGEILGLLQKTYCGRIGADFREINDINAVVWFQEQMESCGNQPELGSGLRLHIHESLTRAEGFERFLQDRYLGQKRFSLEGTDALVPMMDVLIDEAAKAGAEEMNLGMAHRGRLNVLANVLGKDPALIMKEFEGTEFNPFDIDGDVKYHMGFASEVKTISGKSMRLYLSPNPSHLEAVNPVVEGFARARQEELGDAERKRVIPILMHGDAAFIGQGICAETLNMSELESYSTGGTVHIIINNQIGFTANPEEGRSCVYSSEIAKMIRAPVLHVNADDPEAVVWTAMLAIAYRQKFGKDVVIDLIGYRRHGHNETDEPGFTQPLMYKLIKDHPTCLTQYTEQLVAKGVIARDAADERMRSFRQTLQTKMEEVRAGKAITKPVVPPSLAQAMNYTKVDRSEFSKSVSTAVAKAKLLEISRKFCALPASFHAHPKLTRLFEARVKMLEGAGAVDWGMAELMAYGTLAAIGVPVRLSGQDCRRGTFSHRHAVLRDFENGSSYNIFEPVSNKSTPVDVINSPLSEAGVMGFDFGYSIARPQGLTIWEAQFGDFANGAQIIIDQFMSASEAKWKQTSGLVLLLPHGYEGQGPEHSSARLERFLQLCGNLNMQVAYPTTPAQLFHLLRRQVLRAFRKPLIVMSPKSLLRHPKVQSTIAEFTGGEFVEVMDDADVKDASKVKRLVLCSGKIYYDLVAAREEAGPKAAHVPVVRFEQLYPFPDTALSTILARYPAVKELVWTQEEPQNMGAWYFIRHRIEELSGGKQRISYVGRKGSGSTAEGSHKAHLQEQARIVQEALGANAKG